MAATEHLNIPTYEQFAQLLTHMGVIADSMDIIEDAQEMSYTAEAWAVGTKNGIDVGSSDPQYHNNAKYYKEQAEAVAESIPEDYSELSDDVDQLKNALITDTASGTIASFPDGADNFPMRDLTVQMEPIQEGSGDPSPTNIRPISGRTVVTVTMTGKNLYDMGCNTETLKGVTYTRNEDGSYTATGTATGPSVLKGQNINIKAGTYVMSALTTGNSNLNASLYVNNVHWFSITTVPRPFVIERDSIIRLDLYVANGQTANVTFYPQIELGSTATTYEPYQGETYPITFPSSAGTVYGGTVDVTTGVLTVTMAEVDLGTLSWTKDTSELQRFYAALPDAETTAGSVAFNGISSMYKAIPFINVALMEDGIMALSIGRNISVRNLELMDNTASEFKTAMSGAQVVYELATPITYTLTPQQVTTLLGWNNIWSDADSVSVDYVADAKLYIDKELESVNTLRSSIAPVEDGATASQAYAQGRYFFHNGDFCKAKTAIASGATFTLNTNYEVTTVAAELFTAINP